MGCSARGVKPYIPCKYLGDIVPLNLNRLLRVLRHREQDPPVVRLTRTHSG